MFSLVLLPFLAAVAHAADIFIGVGEVGLTFSPPNITANVGDTLHFI